MLKREGTDVNTFASSIRLQRKLEQKWLNEEQIESFVENIDIHCFKHGRCLNIQGKKKKG
jgi:hypothetical protein